MRQCLYCTQVKEESEFSEEHVLPQAVGGNLSPTNPFKTSHVCQRCNNLCGLFVDSGFIKNWFTQAGRTGDALRYLSLDNDTILPFYYMGEMQELRFQDKICELWLSPAGDRVYHFHQPYPEVEHMPILVGPAPTIRRQIDYGFAFIVIASTNPQWIATTLRSFALQFENSDCYLANGPTPQGDLFSEIPIELNDLRASLVSIMNEEHNVRMALTIGYESRFLAKLALGIGHIFLNPSFSESNDADLLRSMLWGRSREQRENAQVRGCGFLGNGTHRLGEMLSWPTGHIIALLPIDGKLTLYAKFYNHQEAIVIISQSAEHWQGRVDGGGKLYAICPGLRKFKGPISIPEFISHQQGIAVDSGLFSLESEARNTPNLPPFI